jgi:hypothetical protein
MMIRAATVAPMAIPAIVPNKRVEDERAEETGLELEVESGLMMVDEGAEQHVREGRDILAAGDRRGVMNVIYGSIFTKGVDDSSPEPLANEVLGLPTEVTTKQVILAN